MRTTNTKITKNGCDWKEVRNSCRVTVNKGDINTPVTEKFKKNILLSEHSPIRELRVKFEWIGIKSWIATHFARHWLGWNKYISTQRDDRKEHTVSRDDAPQSTKVDMKIEANAAALINVGRMRLCHQASDETREYAEDLKRAIKEIEPELSDVMVPNCVYRGGCPEMFPCKENVWGKFIKYCRDNNLTINTIQQRYDAYNQYFYDKNKED